MSKPVESRRKSYFLPGFHFGCLATASWFASDMQEKCRILSEKGWTNPGHLCAILHKLTNLATTNCQPVTLRGSIFIDFILFCARIFSEFDWREKVCKKRGKSTIVPAHFDSFRPAFSVSLSWERVSWREKHKQPKLQMALANQTKKRAFVSISLHSQSCVNEDLERENIISFVTCLWDEEEKKTPNKRKQKKTVSGGDDSEKSGIKTFPLLFDSLRAAPSHMSYV